MKELILKECRLAMKTGKVSISGKEIDVEVGQKRDFSFYSHGWVDKEGNCGTENFVSGEAYFEDSYERTFVNVHIDKIRASITPRPGMSPSTTASGHPSTTKC